MQRSIDRIWGDLIFILQALGSLTNTRWRALLSAIADGSFVRLANTRYRAPPPAIAGSLLVDDARKTNAAFSAALVFLLRSSHAYSLCDLGHFGFV